jgi:hypothetical protein
MGERIQLSAPMATKSYRGTMRWTGAYTSSNKSQQVAPGSYSPPACIGTKIKVRQGNPDADLYE